MLNSGGQESDYGQINTEKAAMVVKGMKKQDDVFIHHCEISEGSIKERR